MLDEETFFRTFLLPYLAVVDPRHGRRAIAMFARFGRTRIAFYQIAYLFMHATQSGKVEELLDVLETQSKNQGNTLSKEFLRLLYAQVHSAYRRTETTAYAR